jgi:hypothetical protein
MMQIAKSRDWLAEAASSGQAGPPACTRALGGAGGRSGWGKVELDSDRGGFSRGWILEPMTICGYYWQIIIA